MLGGEVSATSVVGEGTTFMVRLPARVADIEAEQQQTAEKNKLMNLPVRKVS